MTGRRAYREEGELGEGSAIPPCRPHYGEDRSQRFPLPQPQLLGAEVDWDLSSGQSPTPRCQKSCRSVGPSGTWLAGVREVSPG